jgi:hypothetical protein
MTYNNIYEYFGKDENLMNYYDPTSSCKTNEEAIMEIYHKLVFDHAKERPCTFVRDDIGYLFYSEGLLISFCVKPEYRDKENLSYFGNLIKSKVGQHFKCYLFNINKKAISFLERIGMIQENSNELITLLSI